VSVMRESVKKCQEGGEAEVNTGNRDKDFRFELMISGMGGQGIVLAGLIVAEAVMRMGYEVVHTSSYGPESRGGASRSDVLISTTAIDYPAVIAPDFAIFFTQESVDKYFRILKKGASVLIDKSFVSDVRKADGRHIFELYLTDESAGRFGSALFANMIALGFFAGKQKIVEPEFIEQAIEVHIKKDYRSANLEAFNYGMKLADEILCAG